MIPLRDVHPTRSIPVVTYALMLLHGVAFAYQWWLATLASSAVDSWMFRFGMIPIELVEQPELEAFAKPLTSLFLHGSWQHLAFNLSFLWLFGRAVEDALGAARFLKFYLAAGVIAAAAQVLVDPTGEVPLIGTSGAIAGVLGAHLKLFPRGRFLTLVPVLPPVRPVPAVFFVVIWFVLQLLGGFSALVGPAPGGVVFFAQVGGMLAALWLIDGTMRREAPRGLGRSQYY